MQFTVEDIAKTVDTSVAIKRSLVEWRTILAEECQVYVFNENYIAKRFDQINYKFCEKNEARDVLIDNIYALLRYKYFPKASEEVDARINEIVKSITANLKSTLIKISLDKDADSKTAQLLPDYCIAFRNGVYNFRDDKWLFKYDIIDLKSLANKIYMYDSKYIILWYLNYDFEPFEFSINDLEINEFVTLMKDVTKVRQNYCFELVYNMSHDRYDVFSLKKFEHLSEICGYTILQAFSQRWVMFIGSGQNGKNSLIDGCFTNRLVPMASSNSLYEIENDKFITGNLENKHFNYFLESDDKDYNVSKNFKQITGSPYQTVQNKGVNKYSSYINCKHVYSANDQEQVKFTDNTPGFRRRINMFEVYYSWDSGKRFMKRGDYYDTSFSEDLHEMTNDLNNSKMFVYIGMYGIKKATNNFTTYFDFTENDWSLTYTDIDLDLKDKIETTTVQQIIDYIVRNKEECKVLFFDEAKKRFYLSKSLATLGYHTYDDMIVMLKDEEARNSYFVDTDVFINLRIFQKIIKNLQTPVAFTQAIKKAYPDATIENIYNNQPYIKVNLAGKRLRIITV